MQTLAEINIPVYVYIFASVESFHRVAEAHIVAEMMAKDGEHSPGAAGDLFSAAELTI
jgi:hypothetical protein